jgi:hypothetical protein
VKVVIISFDSPKFIIKLITFFKIKFKLRPSFDSNIQGLIVPAAEVRDFTDFDIFNPLNSTYKISMLYDKERHEKITDIEWSEEKVLKFTGDLGLAMYLKACLKKDERFPYLDFI